MRRMILVVCLLALIPAQGVAAPNDPGWSQQWHLSKIGVETAWRKTTGRGVVVAIVDTGINSSHEDLQGRLVPGRNFIDGGSTADDNGHGTFMAGIVSATTGNRVGVSSVAPAAKLMPIKVLGDDGSGNVSDVAEGVRWATSQGADVINLSLAQENVGREGGRPQNLLGDPLLDRAIKEAAAAGALVVVAAGNDFGDGGNAKTSYDARVSGVVVVGATTRSDERAAYSNYGAGLDLVAPGGGSSTDPIACKDASPIVSTWWDPDKGAPGYGSACGTSMAVAHVSGVGALLMSIGYTNGSAVTRMTSTAVDLAAPGRDDVTGFGRVDALAAVGKVPAKSPTTPRATSNKTDVNSAAGQGPGAIAGTPQPTSQTTPAAESSTAAPPPSLFAFASTGKPPAEPPREILVALATVLTALLAATHLVRLFTHRRKHQSGA